MRPYIKLSTRCIVARRQLREGGALWRSREPGESMGQYLEFLLFRLRIMLGVDELQLDHDPALENRTPVRNAIGNIIEFAPKANDPQFLLYRPVADHLQKTTGRKPGAERTITSKGSDNWIAKKFRKLEGAPRRTTKIPSRPFPKKPVNLD